MSQWTLLIFRQLAESENGVDYGDDFGNRSNRFVSDIAYLDGEKPYAIYLRGYYFGRSGKQRTSIAGISWDGTALSPTYRFDTQKVKRDITTVLINMSETATTTVPLPTWIMTAKTNLSQAHYVWKSMTTTNSVLNGVHIYSTSTLHIGNYDPTHTGFEPTNITIGHVRYGTAGELRVVRGRVEGCV